MPDLFEIIGTTRSMRRFEPDPVPAELIKQILEAGTAPMAVTIRAGASSWSRTRRLKKVQLWCKKAFDEMIGPRYASRAQPPDVTADKYKRQDSAAECLIEHFHQAPISIVACLVDRPKPARGNGASICPAAQIMPRAIRTLGLRSTVTTRHMIHAKEPNRARRHLVVSGPQRDRDPLLCARGTGSRKVIHDAQFAVSAAGMRRLLALSRSRRVARTSCFV
jgi:hypothetical protein